MARKSRKSASRSRSTQRPHAPELSWKQPSSAPSDRSPEPSSDHAPSLASSSPASPSLASASRLSATLPLPSPAPDPAAPSSSLSSAPVPLSAGPSSLAPLTTALDEPSRSSRPSLGSLFADADDAAADSPSSHEDAFFDAPASGLLAEPLLDAPSADDDSPPIPEPVSPAVLRRRLALRKAVSAVLGMAAALAMGMGIKTAAAARHRPDDLATASRPVATQLAAPLDQASKPAPAAPPALTERAPRIPSPPPAAPEAPAAASPEPTPAASVAPPSAAPSADPAAAPAPDPARAKELTRKALQLLERGNNKGAIEQATAAIEADPTDAAPYLYWGTALMELGKNKDARAIFARCVDQATRGPKSDCRQFR